MKAVRAIGVCGMVALGCGRTQVPAPSAPAVAASAPAAKAASCPIAVEGATIEIADTSAGVDVTLMSPPDRVDELRHRARDAASLYGIGAHEGLGHHGAHLGAQRHGLRLTELPPLEARVEDIDGGVRIHLRAELASQQNELRSRMRARVEEIRIAPCD